MNKLERPPMPDNTSQTPQLPADRLPAQTISEAKSRTGRLVFLITVLVLLLGALGIGSWKHYTVAAEAMATAEEYRDFVPNVRTAPVRASGSTLSVIWPATTEAFEQANIYARASGYISKRNVDIGSRVKAGDLLVEIIAPELDHQITQAEGTLAQLKASLLLARANRDLAQVTWDRENPLVQKNVLTVVGATYSFTAASISAFCNVSPALAEFIEHPIAPGRDSVTARVGNKHIGIVLRAGNADDWDNEPITAKAAQKSR
jgi:Biotin-lipoyl like